MQMPRMDNTLATTITSTTTTTTGSSRTHLHGDEDQTGGGGCDDVWTRHAGRHDDAGVEIGVAVVVEVSAGEGGPDLSCRPHISSPRHLQQRIILGVSAVN